MDNNEAIMNETELEKVVAEATVVQEEKEIEDPDISNSVTLFKISISASQKKIHPLIT